MSKENYQQLQPLTVEQRVWIAIAALKFFQPMHYRENCQKIGKTTEENIIRPLDTLGFLKYLAVDGVLPDKMLDKPERYLQRINELLARLVFSGHLSHAGKVARLWLEIVTTRRIKQRVTNDRVFFIWHDHQSRSSSNGLTDEVPI